ncbi:DUF1015 family protein [Balneolaceae bacterium ANBcel3]|nr:DUF1015 family protein [Balneolaceae bacterium ANBcel3]
MITIKPFRAWRPLPENVEKIACVPYDVIDTGEARKLAENRPDSFLHVIRPEIDLPEGIDIYSDIVYQTGLKNLKKLQETGKLIQDKKPTLYLYQQQMGTHTQTGLFTCVSVKDYDEDKILKHELTRPDKEDDRTKHILTQKAHAEPVMLTYRGTSALDKLTNRVLCSSQPVYAFTASDQVIHRVWQIRDTEAFLEAFSEVDRLYVADGHHRCKSASRVAEELRTGDYGDDEFEFFPAVLFPMDQLRILAYNRVVKKAPDNIIELLSNEFEIKKNASSVPEKSGSVRIYHKGTWYGLRFPDVEQKDAVSSLDVSLLHSYILKPYLGIENQRTDPNLVFVGGIRGTKELERRVNSGLAELAISMYPTRIQQLTDVSDAGMLMPPKSTWFEPKLRSGLLVHTF